MEDTNLVPNVQVSNHKSQLLSISLFVLLLLSISLSFYLGYQNQKLKKQVSELSAKPSPTSLAYETLTKEQYQISYWKTYEAGGFMSFKYPPVWDTKPPTIEDRPHFIKILSNRDLWNSSISITYYDNPKNLSIEEFNRTFQGPYYQNSIDEGTFVYPNSKPKRIGNNEWLFLEQNSNNHDNSNGIYVAKTKGKIVKVITGSTIIKDKIIIDQILSTFKFTK